MEADLPLLSVLVVAPAVGALLVALAPKGNDGLVRALGVATTLVVAALSIWVLVAFDASDPGFQLVDRTTWIAEFGISWHLGVDGISLFLVVLTGLLFPIAVIGVKPHHDPKAYLAWLLLLEAGCLGVFLALDLFLFFVMFEIVLVPMYFLIGGWGYGERVYAALKFFLFTMLGSAFMLVGILAVAFLHQRATGVLTFDLVTIAEADGAISQGAARWLFLAFAVAFAVKVPVFPLHTWLPDAHTQAPTAGSVILAGVLKRLVAYSSVAHLGFIVLGTFAFTTQGLQGGVIQMVNHGVSTGALFLLVGMISDRLHTREIARLGGLQKVAPVLAGVFTVVMLSSVGLPGLNGFVGEFLVLIGSFPTRRWWAVVATAGVILAALYLLWAYQRVFHGLPEGERAAMPDMSRRELAVMAPLLAAIVFLGVYPKPVLERIEPAVDRLIAHVEDRSDFTEPEVTATAAGERP